MNRQRLHNPVTPQPKRTTGQTTPIRERVITLGCRLNTYESEIISKNLADQGLDDTIVVNTCAVTGEAVRQARQTIRRLRRENPDARLVVTGCAAQIEPDTFAAMDAVDHVIGNAEKLAPASYAALSLDGAERVRVNDIMSVRETAGQLIEGFSSRSRAYVQVQNGCDHRCTFCIIPYGRGASRSVAGGEVVEQVRILVASGYREIVLTGVDMTSYGADLPGKPPLGRLVRQVLHHVPELERLRLSSIDQVEIDDDLLRAIGEEPRLMPHLHLSMQAGADLTLKRMKRRHLRDDAIRFCEMARQLRPDIVFGADLIAGFPTETDAMFDDTLDIVDACDLTYLHVFPYSARAGTPAARMPQVAAPTIKTRAARLRAKGADQLQRYLEMQVGASVDVLMERPNIGRTPQFAEVEIAAEAPIGSIVAVRITGANGRRLRGECV